MKTDEPGHPITDSKIQAKPGTIFEEEGTLEEGFSDHFYKFEEYIAQNLSDQVLHDQWYNFFIKEPENFFKNIEGLRAMDRNKRILFLIKQCALLSTSTNDIEEYFIEFPDDARYIQAWLAESDYKPRGSYQFNILGLCSEYLERNFHIKRDLSGRGFGIPKQYFETCERKKHAKTLLLSNTSFVDSDERYSPFGVAGKEFKEHYSLASNVSMSGEEMLDTSFMDGNNFERLTEEEKRELLLGYLSSLHEALLFNEVNNSHFTKESVERANERHHEKDREKSKSLRYGLGYNPGHSMIYKTYQPRRVYKMHQDFFVGNMNNTASIGGHVEEYPFHRLLLKTLEKLATIKPNKNVSNLVTEFWNKNRNPIFCEAVGRVLSIHFPENAAVEMMKVIKKEPSNNALSSMLYRLELGTIGISSKGMEYLGRLYDLAEYNDPSFFAQRLSVNGELAIFKQDGEMIGVTSMADPSDLSEKEHEIVYATVNHITMELLFSSKNEDLEEKKLKEEILEAFTKNYNSFQGKDLLENAGVQFNNLTLTEQGWYMLFVKKTKNKEELAHFLAKYKELGVKTLQSMDEGFDMESLIVFVNDADESQCRSVFAIYSEIVDTANGIDIFMGVPMSPEEKEYFCKRIVSSGKNILVKILEGGKSGSLAPVLEELSSLRSETVVFINCFRELRSSGKAFSIEDINGSLLQTMHGGTISAVDKKMMRDVYELNGDNNKVNQELLLREFDKKTTDPSARFHLFKWNNELQSYVVFQDTEDGYTKGSALNVRKDSQGYKIGEAMLTQVISEEAKRRPLIADVLATNTIVPKYLETGWVATRYFVDNGDPILDIVQDVDANGAYWGKSATSEAIISLTAPRKVGRQDVVIEIANNQNDLIEKYKEHFGKGLCLTRIIKNNSGDMWHGVFEPFLKPEPKIRQALDTSSRNPTEELLVE